MLIVLPAILFLYLLATVNYRNIDQPILSRKWLVLARFIGAYILVVSVFLSLIGLDVFDIIEPEQSVLIRKMDLSNATFLVVIFYLHKFRSMSLSKSA